MKLISLEFEGIGAFAGRTLIDFEALSASGLFLIEGPTGSGKSTILDAVVFALYGSPAGSESDLGRLDSQLRQRSASPYVELTFECGAGRYRIRRSPRHQRDKVRGNGTTDDNGSVSLMQIAPDVLDLGHKAREVGDWIIENVGLTKGQFAATIVLAQGEFASFLDADTATRAQILERVFGTEFYKHIEDQLAAMRRSALALRNEAAGELRGAIDRCLGALGLEPGDDDLRQITEEVRGLQAEESVAAKRAVVAGQNATLAEAELAAAESLVAAQQRKRDLVEREDVCTRRRPAIDELRKALREHQRAKPVQALHQQVSEAAEHARFVDAQVRLLGTQLAEMGLDDVGEADARAADQTLGEIRAAEEAEQGIPELETLATHLQGQKAVDVDALNQLLLDVHAAKAEEYEAKSRVAHLPDAGERLAQAHLEVERLTRQAELETQIAELTRRLQSACDDQSRAASLLAEAREVLAEVERRHQLDQAAMLAEQLVAGQPCLVCGASEHPHPAVLPTQPSSDVRAAERVQTQRREEWVAAQDTVHRIEAQIEVLGQSVSASGAELREALSAAKTELAESEAAVAELRLAREAAQRSAEQLESLSRAVAAGELRAQRSSEDARQAELALSTARALVERGRGEHATVSAHIRTLENRSVMIRDYLAMRNGQRAAQAAADQAQHALDQTLASVGFSDADQALAALMDEITYERLEAEVRAFDEAEAEIAAGMASVRDVDLSVTVDLEVLGHNRDARQREFQLASAAHGSIEYRLQQAGPLWHEVQGAVTHNESIWESTEAVIRMADYATANRSEVVHKVRLSSFVLMRRFQAVVDAANDRLDAISDGRYQLAVLTTGLDHRAQAGLDLVIADQHTEHTRSTKSLSGGERFYVALALALGLADVVRSESGGVELGTLFIDEGFGSLDERTLDEVMDMLEQVRAGQDRVIGLVSHVPLLKERIDPRISVTRDPQRPGVSTLEVRV